MREASRPAELKAPAAGKRPIEDVRGALRGKRGAIGALVFMQLLALAGLGGLLRRIFRRTG